MIIPRFIYFHSTQYLTGLFYTCLTLAILLFKRILYVCICLWKLSTALYSKVMPQHKWARARNYFSHCSSGPPVRTHLHTANHSPEPLGLHVMNIHDLRLRNKSTHARGLVILLQRGKEERVLVHARCIQPIRAHLVARYTLKTN